MNGDKALRAARLTRCGSRLTAPGLGPRLPIAVMAIAAAGAVALAGCQAAAPAASAIPPVRTLTARPAPVGWHLAALSGGGAVLAYPPAMHPVISDRGAVSAAQLATSGGYLMYLNATPKQGKESLRNWPAYRVDHLREDDASAVRLLAESRGVRFIGGTGTCVLDAYVTKAKSHHFTEVACLVQGRTSASVIVAAAPTTGWRAASGQLMRAVAAYQVR